MTHNDEISLEEKIDYIYNRMRRQQKAEIFWSILKWGTRFFIVASLIYFFFVKLPILKDEIVESITPEVPQFDMESISNSNVLNNLKDTFSNFWSTEDLPLENDAINSIKY